MSAPLRIYEADPASDPSTLVTVDGDFTNPDDEASLDGTSGETSVKALWIAVEQTTIAEDLDDSETEITITSARFADTDYSVVIVNSEKMLITAGHGTTTLTVTRGYNSTTAATHTNGDEIQLAYTCTGITIDCSDTTGTDESGWMTYCDDDGGGSPDGSYSAPHTPGAGSVAHTTSLAIHRKLIVPASTAASLKRDLVHRLAATVNEYSA